jgi:cell division protein FtsB
MKEIKRRMLRVFLLAEVVGLTGWYLVGTNGLQALRQGEKQNRQLLAEIDELNNEVTALKQELEERERDSFYKEKIARQELQMAKEGEEIYLLPHA